MSSLCDRCEKLAAELKQSLTDLSRLREQVREMAKLAELQAADLDRYRKVIQEQAQPNRPERVPDEQLQLAWERIMAAISDPPTKTALESSAEENRQEKATKKSITPHGRRKLDIAGLPIKEIRITPNEVLESNLEGWELISEETSNRLAFRKALYFCVRIVREKWVRKIPHPAPTEPNAVIAIGAQPDYVWPNVMADPSVIADVLLSKYDYLLPLHRQERQTRNRGFAIPRSTQSDWLSAAYELLRHVVDAMHTDSLAHSHCIATDATGAPVRAPIECHLWHVFVFIGDRGHITFRHSRRHTSAAITNLLRGFRGRLLSDASSIYDALYRVGLIAVSCWAHVRRYFWRAVLTEPDLAYEALALIKQLFLVAKWAKKIPLPERTKYRAERAGPILEVFDRWVERNRSRVDPRGKLDAAMTYYSNQRDSLRTFLEDGRLDIDNNHSERELRNLIGGRDNWKHFENETGLRWYTTFRSLIASCEIEQLNPHEYLEPVLRLLPHWPRKTSARAGAEILARHGFSARRSPPKNHRPTLASSSRYRR